MNPVIVFMRRRTTDGQLGYANGYRRFTFHYTVCVIYDVDPMPIVCCNKIISFHGLLAETFIDTLK